MAKKLTNDQFMKKIMNYAPTGALSHVFVLQAITQFAKQVAAASAEELDVGLVSGEAWKATAEFILEEYKANYQY